MKIRPIGGYVLIDLIKKNQKIMLPENSAMQESYEFKVVATSTRINSNGDDVRSRLKVGDLVLFKKDADIIRQSETRILLHESEIIAVGEEE